MVWLIAAECGFDNLATLELSGVSIILMAMIPSIGATIYGVWYFSPAQLHEGPPPFWNLRHDGPGRWVAKGILGIAIISAVMTGFSYPLTSLLPQHFWTTQVNVSVTAVALRKTYGAAAFCRTELYFRTVNGVEESVCFSVTRALASHSSLARFVPEVGDPLELTIVNGVFGSAVVGIERPPRTARL